MSDGGDNSSLCDKLARFSLVIYVCMYTNSLVILSEYILKICH